MNIKRGNIPSQKLSFSGHNKSIDKTGYEKHNFYYLYDSGKYSCQVELYNIAKDKNGNISLADKEPAAVVPMRDGGISLDMSEVKQINGNEGFAYRFKLTDKTKAAKVSYAYDNGAVIGIFDTENTDNKYNVVLNNRATINKNGPMQLIMPDFYYPGVKNVDGKPVLDSDQREKALKSVRNHANKLGGNFYGVMERLPQLEEEGIKRIVGTPFTKDTISSHLYWTENAYQVAPTLGTEKDFQNLQVELFKHGINWIADAALVNEGFGGIHLSEVLRKGPDAFAKNMFRTGERLSLGILPDKCDYTRMKIINAPFSIENGKYTGNNSDYNPAKPTYIQFYDDRLASEEQKMSDSPSAMTTYDNKNTDNIYDITKHDHAVYPFAIEVSPSELERNVKDVIKTEGTLDLSNIDTIKRVADFTYFNVVNKSDAGGLEVWDGNVDIAKLNFYRSDKDDSKFYNLPPEEREEAIKANERGSLAVRDYAVNSGKYWTKLTADTQFEYVSNMIGVDEPTVENYMAKIKQAVKDGQLPKLALENIDEEVVKNVLDDDYRLRRLDDLDKRADINPEGTSNNYSLSDYITRKTMDVPYETLPFATNLLGIMTSPYIAKKANIDSELGVSRYDLAKANNPNLPAQYSKIYSSVDKMYSEQITPLISDILSSVDGLSEDGEVSEYGKYVISEVAPDLTKYILIKALKPNADIQIDEKGHFDFTKVNPEEITMQSLGIPYNSMTSEEEAKVVVDLLKKGISDIKSSNLEPLKQKMAERFENRTLTDFKMAEMIMDRTESGLGWRIDATKDIASIDAVRAGVDSATSVWNKVIDFWKLYNQSVLEINPHAYTTAEITDLYDLFNGQDLSVFTSDADAERKFIEETGITSVANYNYFFSLLPDLYAPMQLEDFDDPSGWQAREEMNKNLLNKIDSGWGQNPGFLFQSPEDGVKNSYTFVGNHDKQRLLHALALDMNIYRADSSSKNLQEAAIKLLQTEDIDFDKINSKAVAMGSRLSTAIDETVKDETLKKNLKDALKKLVSGSHKGSDFDAEAFGTRPFEIAIKTVFDEVAYANGTEVENRQKQETKLLRNILEPAIDRYLSIYKLLNVIPGSPTDFAGDRVGLTGAEEKAKNYHQQNRNIIHWEWLNDENSAEYSFIKELYQNANEIANLRSNPKLSALNDGDTVTIPVLENPEDVKSGKNQRVQAILRYNDKGSVVLAITDSTGASAPLNKKMDRTKGQNISRLYLDPSVTNAKQGLKHGLKERTVFKNVRAEDDSNYVVVKSKNGYYVERRNSKGQPLPITIKPEDLNTLVLYKK